LSRFSNLTITFVQNSLVIAHTAYSRHQYISAPPTRSKIFNPVVNSEGALRVFYLSHLFHEYTTFTWSRKWQESSVCS